MQKAEGLDYEVIGDGEAVLLIHGSMIADAFVPLMGEAALADQYRLINYHRRGFAGSDPVSGSLSVEQQARDALCLLTHLGVERAHVIGYSYGGMIAVQLAVEAPSLVHSLVVLEPAVMPKDSIEAFVEEGAPSFAAYRSGDFARANDLFWEQCAAPNWREVIAKTVPGGPEQADKDAPTFFDVEMPALQEWVFDSDQASRISQPILYFMGGEATSVEQTSWQHFQSLLPHAEKVVVPGLSHILQMQAPKLFAAPIAEFLVRHPIDST